MAKDPRLRMTAASRTNIELGCEDHQVSRHSAFFYSAGVRSCHDEIMDSSAVILVNATEVEIGESDGDVDGEREADQKLHDPRMPRSLRRRSTNSRTCLTEAGAGTAYTEGAKSYLFDELMSAHADLCFLGDQCDPGNTVLVLVLRELSTRMTMAAAVPRTTTSTQINMRVVAFIQDIGVVHGDVLVRSGQGACSCGGRQGGGRYVMEQSPVGCKPSNGIVERQGSQDRDEFAC